MGKWSKEQKEAARQLLARRKARKNFWAFCQYMDADFFTDTKKHLKKIAQALQKVSEGKIFRLMLSLPPRAGKSYIISMFCAWLLGLNPEGSIMRNCYAASLAHVFSRDVRSFVRSTKYLELFPEIKLKKSQSAVDNWALESSKTTAYFCAGVDGGINGKGCTLVAILDDPIKSFRESCSDTVRRHAWQWKIADHDARVEGSKCPEIVIATRWNKEDPSGMLLKLQKGWKEIKFPALDKDDKSFCEEIKSTEYYHERRALLDRVIWEAEYQQNPVSAAGLLYPEEELSYFTWDEVRKFENAKYPESWEGTIIFTDTADTGIDNLSSPVGKKLGGKVYIVDWIHTQDSVETTEPLVAEQVVHHSPDVHIIESNNGGRSFCLNVRKLIKGRTMAFPKWKFTSSNKQTRMLMKAGKVKKDFVFLAPTEYPPESDYAKAIYELTGIARMVKIQPDDSGDALTGMAEMVDKKGLQFG